MVVRGDHTFLDLHMAVLPPKVITTIIIIVINLLLFIKTF